MFGKSLTSCGKTVVIGATGGSKSGVRSGAAYVIDLDSKTEVHKLTPSDGEDDDWFGNGVAIDGNFILVSTGKGNNGAVYVFDALSGKEVQKFVNTDTPEMTEFGSGSSRLAIHAGTNVGIVGHPTEDGNLTNAGAVYVFDLNTGAQIRKLTPAVPAAGMLFGSSLCLMTDGKASTLIIGAPGAVSNDGRVYTFDIEANWMEVLNFPASDNERAGRFGENMFSSGPYFVIAASGHDDGLINGTENGAVYSYIGNRTASSKYSKFYSRGVYL